MAFTRLYVCVCYVILVANGSGIEYDKRLVLHSETDVTAEIYKLQQELAAMQKELQVQKNTTTSLKRENEQLRLFQQSVVQGSGSVYVRWGRNVCPSPASLVYKGFTAGKHYNTEGSGTNNLCVPSEPTWSKYNDALQTSYRALLFGTELDVDDNEQIFHYPVHEEDMPCAVCLSPRSTILMIPGRNNCYSNWTLEYHGYLMTGHHTIQAYEHICVDGSPEFLQHGGKNDNEHILYLVEGRCGSLPCPPYVDGRELACAVCSK